MNRSLKTSRERFTTCTKYVGIGLLSFVGFVLLFGIPTALLPTPWFMRMMPARALDYVFLLINSALLGSYVGLITFEKHRYPVKDEAVTITGGIANFLAVGCPICNKLFVALLGFSAIMTYVEPARVWLGLLSTGIVAGALLFKLRKLKGCCEPSHIGAFRQR